MKLQFLGAARQVTGSRYYLEAGGLRLLIDCGLFQERHFLPRNWETPPFDPARIDFLLLTHAHLDHTGLIPRIVNQGLKCPILATSASVDLARLVMLDSAKIQEEDADFKCQRHQEEGRECEHDGKALYTSDDAQHAMNHFRPVDYDKPVPLNDNVSVRWVEAGHILGAAMLELTIRENGRQFRLVFSGDMGMWDKPLIPDPTFFDSADYVVMESTYGDRDHVVNGGVEEQLGRVIRETVAAHGNIIIPTFAIERAQELMYYIANLTRAGKIPDLMVFLDSPMAVGATEVFTHHPEGLNPATVAQLRSGKSPFEFHGLRLLRTTQESKTVNQIRGSCVIMAGSGMCTAGRIKHHLAHHINEPATTILFVGYQAEGTLGREILQGSKRVRIQGKMFNVNARIVEMTGLSAHADRKTLMNWLSHFKQPPQQLFLTHGEEPTALHLADEVRKTLKWNVTVPEYKSVAELT